MGLELVLRELPSLPPIKTTVICAKPLREDETKSAAGDEEVAAACVTPKSEQHVLKPALVCPPAPRKPRPVKRKMDVAPPKEYYFQVPSDLASVFIPISSSGRKKIRVG